MRSCRFWWMPFFIPTLAAAVSLGVMGLVTSGCGYVTRRSIFCLLPGEARVQLTRADLSMGLQHYSGSFSCGPFAFRISLVTAPISGCCRPGWRRVGPEWHFANGFAPG